MIVYGLLSKYMHLGKLWTWKYQELSISLPSLRFFLNWNPMKQCIEINKSSTLYPQSLNKIWVLSM